MGSFYDNVKRKFVKVQFRGLELLMKIELFQDEFDIHQYIYDSIFNGQLLRMYFILFYFCR